MYLTHLTLEPSPGLTNLGDEKDYTMMTIKRKYSDGTVGTVCEARVPIAPAVMEQYDETAWHYFWQFVGWQHGFDSDEGGSDGEDEIEEGEYDEDGGLEEPSENEQDGD